MKAEEYHAVLAPLEGACRLAGWGFLTCPLTGGRLMILFRHVSLIFNLYKIRRRRILLREFSTVPLLAVWPLLWPLRKRLFFLVHHNLQWAERQWTERCCLNLLLRLGLRCAFLERVPPGFGKGPARHLALPFPMPEVTLAERGPAEAVPVIGVAGWYRAEKGMDELISLLQEQLPEFRLLVGIPNPEAAEHLSALTVNTAAKEDYLRMLARCDVLVQNGARESYFHRASGPAADAVACSTAVVAPDFPLLRSQLRTPVPVGEVFDGLENLPAAVRVAVEKARAGAYDFEAYREARSARALARVLDAFSAGEPNDG